MISRTEPTPVLFHSIKKIRHSRHGAITIEYAVIFPLVIFVVMLLVYIGLVYYQQALLQSVVTANAQDWALLWGYDAQKVHPGEGILGAEGYNSEALYWHIFPEANPKKENIRNAILRDYERKSILKSSRDVQVEVSFKNYLLFQKVDIKATAIYTMPMKGFFQAVGLTGDFTLQAFSEISVHDPKEFIHNVDYLLQIYDESGAKDWVMEKCKPLMDSLKKVKDYFK
jgi:hypothetical protein